MSHSPRPFTPLHLVAIFVCVVIWAMNFIPMKFGLRDFTPFQLGTARFLFAAVPLVFWVKPPRIGWRWLTLYALVQGLGQFGFLFVALKVGMTAALASVLMQMQVFVTALLGALLLGEHIGRPLKLGIALSAAGLACFAFNALEAGGGQTVTLAGLLLNIAAAAMWAGSIIIVKKVQAAGLAFDPLALVVWSSLQTAVTFALVSLAVDGVAAQANWLHASLRGWISVVYLGWIANVLAYWIWTHMLHRYPASRISPVTLGMPVIGLLAGIFILGERVNAWQWGGAALVISALFCVVGGPGLLARGRPPA